MKKLSKKQIEALKDIILSNIVKNFYLAGGTALTIKYNHRFSEDFDFFCFPEKQIDFLHITSLISSKNIIELDKRTLIFIYKDIKFSFFEYKYPLIRDPEHFSTLNLQIATDEDIAAMKAIAIMQRGEKKDFFDLWYLIKYYKWQLKDIFHFCKIKYSDSFNEHIFLKSLVFFKDAEDSKILEIDPYWDEIKNYFKELVKNFIL